jgi:hypothetical protein
MNMKQTKELFGADVMIIAAMTVLAGCGGTPQESGGSNSTEGGVTWTAVGDAKFGPYIAINGIAWGGGRFVAVGGFGKVAYSEDDVNWTAVEDAVFGDSFIRSGV